MDDTTAQITEAFKKKKKLNGIGCILFFCLSFLIGGAIPSLLNFSGVLARFTGTETTAQISANESCTWIDTDNNTITGYKYIYTFTVSSGRVYEITNTNCNSGPDTVGATETIWYLPADPTHFVTANQWNFDWMFFLGFSIPMDLFVFFSFRWLFRKSFASSSSLPTQDNM